MSGELPSKLVYEDNDLLVFEDIAPVAPIHWVGVTKKHIPSIKETTDEQLVGHLVLTLSGLAKARELQFRLVNNCGPEAGQTVEHLHIHLISGEKLGGMA